MPKKTVFLWVAFGYIIGVLGIRWYYNQKLEPHTIDHQPTTTLRHTKKMYDAVITVFIHGSLYPDQQYLGSISLNDLRMALTDSFDEESPYIESLKIARKKDYEQHQQVIDQEGLHEISIDSLISDIESNNSFPLSLEQSLSNYDTTLLHGTYHTLSYYHALMQKLAPSKKYSYYTFGHLGALSQRYREKKAYELYDLLVTAYYNTKAKYGSTRIIILAHSHGGNIALNLAKAENKFRKGLVVNDLVLFGTPLQYETFFYAYHPLFKRVINCYSEGDATQELDLISTAIHKSYKTFEEITPYIFHKKSIFDIKLEMPHNKQAISHTDMWAIRQSVTLDNQFSPMPYLIITPLLLELFDKHIVHVQHLISAIGSEKDLSTLTISNQKTGSLLYSSQNLLPVFTNVRQQIVSFLKQYDETRNGNSFIHL